jgi:excisionase family DNA binding protein
MERLLRVEEVAHRLGLSQWTVRQMIREGHLPTVRPTLRRAIRIPEDAVERIAEGK